MIIGLKGKAGAGKDTVADYLVNSHGFIKLSFATAVKKIVSIISGWSLEQLQGDTEHSRKFRETVVHTEFNMTGRELLQYVGTDLFRNNFDSDVWVKIIKSEIIERKKLYQNVVISDVRFVNEVEMIQGEGGYILDIRRPTEKLLNVPTHESEQTFKTMGEIVVENSKDLVSLFRQIDIIVKRLNCDENNRKRVHF